MSFFDVLWNFFVSLLWYPRLLNATDEQRENYEVDSEGIRWDELDEDISFESFTYDNPMPEGISYIFKKHPELNAAAIARRMGMKQSLLAAYISGHKKPSEEREQAIVDEIKKVGEELVNVDIESFSIKINMPNKG